MATTNPIKAKIKTLKAEYDILSKGKESLLKIIDESEISESVFNSNAIENSTLTLQETEKILLDLEVSRNISVREVFETKNLARVMEYVKNKAVEIELSKEMILFLHKMLISNINDSIAGRFREKDEYVRIGTYIGTAPEHIEKMIDETLFEYLSGHNNYFIDNITKFHLDFESIHPFIDGNGRIGRVIINYQLIRQGFPNVIIRNKEKKIYYKSFDEYHNSKNTKVMEKILALSLIESLHKRTAYLKGNPIITLADYAKVHNKSVNSLINLARRQTISAFREKGVWKISKSIHI